MFLRSEGGRWIQIFLVAGITDGNPTRSLKQNFTGSLALNIDMDRFRGLSSRRTLLWNTLCCSGYRHGLEGVESTLGIVVCRIVGIIVDNRFQVGQTPGF